MKRGAATLGLLALSCPCLLPGALHPSQLLLGFPPFNHKQRALIEDKIRDEVPRFPRGMSDNAREFILAALNKDPMQRPTIRELLVHPWIRVHRRNGSMRMLLPQSPKQLAFEEVRSMTADQACSWARTVCHSSITTGCGPLHTRVATYVAVASYP